MTMYRNSSLYSSENHSRSILKPEYSHWSNDNQTRLRRYEDNSLIANGEHGPPHRRSLPKRQTVHPYSRYMPDFSLPNARGSYKNLETPTQRSKSTSDYSNSIKQRYLNMQKLNRSKANQDQTSNSKQGQKVTQRTPHHGHAEQIRRSRESNTFSLIDAQLCKPPMDRIRELYLQVKGISTNAGNAPRTTKKANLSAVHAIVRFRIRDYLLEMRDHSRRLLDQVIASQRNEEPSVRHMEMEHVYSNLSSFPCSRNCTCCERLQTRVERPRVTPVRRAPQPRPVIPAQRTSSFHSYSNNLNTTQSKPPLVNFQSISVKTEEPVVPSLVPEAETPPQCATTNGSAFTNDSSQFSNSDVDDFISPDLETPLNEIHNQLSISLSAANDQKTLWSAMKPIVEPEVIKMEEPMEDDVKPVRLCKRNRIDSNVSRFCQELGLSAIDWSMGDLESTTMNACGEYPVDLSLLYDCKESPNHSQSRFSTGEEEIYSPATCDSDLALNQESLLFGADIQVN